MESKIKKKLSAMAAPPAKSWWDRKMPNPCNAIQTTAMLNKRHASFACRVLHAILAILGKKETTPCTSIHRTRRASGIGRSGVKMAIWTPAYSLTKRAPIIAEVATHERCLFVCFILLFSFFSIKTLPPAIVPYCMAEKKLNYSGFMWCPTAFCKVQESVYELQPDGILVEIALPLFAKTRVGSHRNRDLASLSR